MARGPLAFKQTDIERAVKAVRKAGETVQKVQIDKDGNIVVIIGRPEQGPELAYDKWKSGECTSV